MAKKDSLLGLGAILFGLVGFLILVRTAIISPRALPSASPREVRLTNVSENSLSVSWLTDASVKGFLYYSADSQLAEKKLALDDRPEQPSAKIHQVTLKNLFPGTTYYFTIAAGEETFANQGVPFQFTTPQTPPVTPLPPLILKGKVVDPEKNPLKDVLVYFSFQDSTPISTLTDENGNFLVNLNNCRVSDWSVSYPLQPQEKGYLMVVNDTDSLVHPVIIAENLTIETLILGQAPVQDGETVSPPNPPPQSLAKTLPVPVVKEEKLNFIQRLIRSLKRLFTYKR